MSAAEVLLEGVRFGESPRWHEGRLWFSDWGAGQVIALDPAGGRQVMASVRSFPLCFDFLPNGSLLLVDSARRRLLRQEPDGSLVPYADLRPLADKPWNDIVVSRAGHAYVNCIGFEFPGEPAAPGLIALVTPAGGVRLAADGLAFPNGMAITADGATLIVAESYASQLTAFDIAADGTLSRRRTWAPAPGDHPDGICVDADGAVWYADVGTRRCVRVREGGAVLDVAALDRGAFACALSRGPGPRLFVVGQHWGGPAQAGGGTEAAGLVVAFPAPAPGAGWP